ncbi:MAG TPA: CaiB/BaiF CoA-transferase family protein [Myxococcota bacterium]|nr:CaiB/BaiF CoA-transferase family protein [Myxococcota bacterium]
MSDVLEGVRILDLSRLLPGPYATQLLADLGADVVKIEEPGRGDYARGYGLRLGEHGAHFALLNRSKRSVALDLKRPAARDAFLRLADRADVVVESFRPGVMDRLGLGAELLRARNPRLVYCAISGYGQDGPYRDRPGHDLNYCATAGAISLSGPPDPDADPALQGCQLADVGGGALMAVMGVLAALLARARTGAGQVVDVSMLEGTASLLTYAFAELFARRARGEPPAAAAPRRGTARLHGGRPGYGVYRCQDGRHVALAALEEKFWARFCALAGRPDLAPRHAPATPADVAALRAELDALFATRPRDEWVALMAADEVCLTPVHDLAEAAADPQLQARGFFTALPDGTPQLAFPVKLSATPARPPSPAPALGAHTRALLAEAGLSEAEIAAALD